MGLLTFASNMWLQNRRLKLVENKDDRDGYGALITTLQEAVKSMDSKHSEALKVIRLDHSNQVERLAKENKEHLDRIAEEHRRCEERLSKIEGELMGFHRAALTRSQYGLAELPASPMIIAAAERSVAAANKAAEQQRGGNVE